MKPNKGIMRKRNYSGITFLYIFLDKVTTTTKLQKD